MAWAAAIPIALSVAGSAAKAGGSLKAGQASSQAQQYQAQVARNNAIALRQMADRTEQGGMVNADVAAMRGAAKVGAIKAKQGASGINVNKGSAVDVRAGAAESAKFDAETVLSNANLDAYGYRVKASQEEAQAGLYSMGASNAIRAGQTAAIGSLLEGASAIPFNWSGGGDTGGASGIDKEIANWSNYGVPGATTY